MIRQTAMAEALRLTRAGKVLQATSLLRGLFNGETSPSLDGAAPTVDITREHGAIGKGASARDAGTFEERVLRSGATTMPYWLYRPACAAADMPLVVMLHGCTQSPQDFATGTGMNRLADELGFVVAYPQQSQRANPQKCWNWFNPADQQRDHGEPAMLAGITRAVIADERIDPTRVYVAGLSAGGAAAAIMAAAYPDLFAAVGIHSGLGCGVARDLPSALAAMKRGGSPRKGGTGAFVPVITFHGTRDATVNAVNSRDIVAAATAAAGVSLEVRTEGGHSASGRAYTRALSIDPAGKVLIEQWTIDGFGHAWAGGDPAGSYADPNGPEASREMMRFFLSHRRA